MDQVAHAVPSGDADNPEVANKQAHRRRARKRSPTGTRSRGGRAGCGATRIPTTTSPRRPPPRRLRRRRRVRRRRNPLPPEPPTTICGSRTTPTGSNGPQGGPYSAPMYAGGSTYSVRRPADPYAVGAHAPQSGSWAMPTPCRIPLRRRTPPYQQGYVYPGTGCSYDSTFPGRRPAGRTTTTYVATPEGSGNFCRLRRRRVPASETGSPQFERRAVYLGEGESLPGGQEHSHERDQP